MTHKTNKSLKWVKITTSAIIVTIGIGAILYACTQYSSLSRTEDDKRKSIGKSGKPSKAIIITNSVVRKAELDWSKLLQDDIVLIVLPKVSFFNDEEKLPHLHKIIRCDTLTGLWSCIRHLRKDQLLYIEEEISGGLPDDIGKYVPTLVTCKDAHDLGSKV